VLHEHSPQSVKEMVSSITVFSDSVKTTKALVQPSVRLHAIDDAPWGNENEVGHNPSLR